MDISKKKFNIIFIAVFSILFGLIGSIYNKKTSQLWFLKYSIGIKPEAYILGDVIDRNIRQLKLGVSKARILDFTRIKTYRTDSFLVKNISKIQISPDNLVIHVEGNLDEIEKKLETIMFKFNEDLKNEINLLLNSYIERAVIELEAIRQNNVKYYEEIVNLKNTNRDIYILNSIKKNLNSDLPGLEQLKIYLHILDSDILLQKNKTENVNDRYELKIIRDAKEKLINQDIYHLIDRVNKYSLKPSLIVSISGFALFGFFISTLILFLIKLTSKKSQKKLFKFFNIN